MRIARPTVVGSRSEPAHGRSRLAEQRISGRYSIFRVVKVDIPFPLLERAEDVGFCPLNVARLGKPDGTRAGDDAAAIFRMRLQIRVDQAPRFLAPSGVLKRPGERVMPG